MSITHVFAMKILLIFDDLHIYLFGNEKLDEILTPLATLQNVHRLNIINIAS